MINGILVIDKEAGFTSHDVVAKLRGICGQKRIGHTGTLDPAATGVLPVCLGNATKLCDMLTDRDKEYVAELLLGVETDTQDVTGKVISSRPVQASEEDLRRVCGEFVGTYNQIPPMYSALKVNGRRLYELAREGREVERKARPVVIRELEIMRVELPVVTMRVVCSKGTYIRTLCADIGERLGCGGTMRGLRRTRVGEFGAEQALTLGQAQRMKDEGTLWGKILPVDSVFTGLPAFRTAGRAAVFLENGNPIPADMAEECGCIAPGGAADDGFFSGHTKMSPFVNAAPGQRARFYRPDGGFAAIYAFDSERNCYMPVKMFL